MRHSRQGSALLLVLVLGSVLLLGLAALIGTALNEHRNSERAVMGSSAFFLAEAGIDRTTPTILDDAFTAAGTKWTARGANTFTRTFPADTASLGGRTGGYTVVVQRADTLYTVSSKGWVANSGVGRTERAIEVVFDRVLTNNGSGKGAGCIARNGFLAGSTGDSTISLSQVGPTFDSYISENNTSPGPNNRDNKCLVGTLSAVDGALNLSNGKYYATVGTGSSPAEPTPDVKVAKNASPPNDILAKVDDPADKINDPVAYNAALVRHDLDVTVDPVIPPDAPAKDGWYQVLPKDGNANTQWKLGGKLADFDPKKNATPANMTVTGNTANIGSTNSDKHYIATTSLDNINTLNISGEVILVCLGPINASNGMTVNYKTADAKLTIYATDNISGVIKTTQQMSTGAAVPNYESKRLSIGMLPGNHNINMQSLEPTAINAHTTTAAKNPTAGGTIIMNFGDRDTFVGQINAPYSTAQLSAVGQKGKLSDYCGSLLANTISITGSNGFAFHYDESAGGGGGGAKTPTLVRESWRQLAAADSVFQ
jgi:hypothetical protein